MVVANFTKSGKAGYSLPLKDGKPLFVSGEQEISLLPGSEPVTFLLFCRLEICIP